MRRRNLQGGWRQEAVQKEAAEEGAVREKAPQEEAVTKEAAQEAALQDDVLQEEDVPEEALQRILQDGPAGRGAKHEDGVQKGRL